MNSKTVISSALATLMALTLLPLDTAVAAQTRSVVGGTLYDLRCNGVHDLQLGTLNATSGEFTNIGDANLGSTTGINTCLNLPTHDPTERIGSGYVLSSSFGVNQIYSLNFITGQMSSGAEVILDPKVGSFSYPMGFTAHNNSKSFYVLYTRIFEGSHDGIYVAKINPVTRSVTDRYFVADGNSLLAISAAAAYVLSGFAFNPVDSKLYIATGNSDGGDRTNGHYHLWTLDPTTGGLVDLTALTTLESENSDSITPHSFFSMTFDNEGTIWGLTNSRPKGLVSTQSATVSGWSVPNNLSLSTARVKAGVDGEDDQLVFLPSVPFVAKQPVNSSAAAAALAAAAAAKREAEIKAARNEISNKLAKSQSLTLDSFKKAEISGVTAENFTAVQAEILALPIESRAEISQVLKIARKYEVVGKIASNQASTLPISAFVEAGLLTAENKNKTTLIAAVKRAPESERSSFASIQAVIAEAAAKIKERKDRLAATISRIKSR